MDGQMFKKFLVVCPICAENAIYTEIDKVIECPNDGNLLHYSLHRYQFGTFRFRDLTILKELEPEVVHPVKQLPSLSPHQSGEIKLSLGESLQSP